ncbi:MAG: TIGR01212 family radical SAM protein [Prevotella sp.]|nr:TIGR01212 family radical SAM protein [Prevotella sp.]
MQNIYNDYTSWIREKLPFKVQKISIDAGLGCPNRDGTIGVGGCIYCNNSSFNPGYCHNNLSITMQIEEGKRFFGRKYNNPKYLAYFQAHTNTYGENSKLMTLYKEALAVEDVVGIVIGTRPDCVNESLLDDLAELSHSTFVMLEYGIESVHDRTLKLINRGHTFERTRKAIEETARRGIFTGGHVILGLPGEDNCEILQQATIISSLPLDVLKIHQLQVIRNTPLARQYEDGKLHVFSLDEYISLLASYIQRLRPTLALERFVSQCPSEMLIAPRWGLKPQEFNKLLESYMGENRMKQGDSYIPIPE